MTKRYLVKRKYIFPHEYWFSHAKWVEDPSEAKIFKKRKSAEDIVRFYDNFDLEVVEVELTIKVIEE